MECVEIVSWLSVLPLIIFFVFKIYFFDIYLTSAQFLCFFSLFGIFPLFTFNLLKYVYTLKKCVSCRQRIMFLFILNLISAFWMECLGHLHLMQSMIVLYLCLTFWYLFSLLPSVFFFYCCSVSSFFILC